MSRFGISGVFTALICLIGIQTLGQDGTVEGHFDNGQLKSRTTYHNGIKHGDSFRWYPNGNLQLQQHFVRGVKSVEYAYYMFAPGLKMWERAFLPEDSTTFRSREWYPNKQLKGEFVTLRGQLHGHFTHYTESGRELSKTYHHGTLVEGTDWFRIDRPNRHESFERIYKDSVCTYLKWTSYNEQGKVAKTESYAGNTCSQLGVKDGIWEEWYPNGQLIYRQEYQNGVAIGVWTWWYESGALKTRFKYENGKVVAGSIEEWAESEMKMKEN